MTGEDGVEADNTGKTIRHLMTPPVGNVGACINENDPNQLHAGGGARRPRAAAAKSAKNAVAARLLFSQLNA